MDLTEKYMQIQGNFGYLHKVSKESANNYVVAYATEGSLIQYIYLDTKEEAEKMIEYWGKTGDLIIENYSFITKDLKKTIEKPTMVRLLIGENTYRRKNYPPED